MFTIEELTAEKDAVLIKARALTEYITSDAFYDQSITESERYFVKKQERALLEYHASLISQIELKALPMKTVSDSPD